MNSKRKRAITVRVRSKDQSARDSKVVFYDHPRNKDKVELKSFGHKVVDSISARIGGGGYVLVDDDIAFSSVVSNEPKEKLAEILSDFRKTEQSLPS